MKSTKELQTALKELRVNAIALLSEKLPKINKVFVSEEDFEIGSYNTRYITLRNGDDGEVYEVIIVSILNGEINTLELNDDYGNFEELFVNEIESVDDLIGLLNLISEDNKVQPSNIDFKIGDMVLVGEPKLNDLHHHSFMGEIRAINIKESYCTVVDGEGDCFDIDFDNLEKQDDE